MPRLLTPRQELDQFLDRKAAIFAKALRNVAKAWAEGPDKLEAAERDLAGLLQSTLSLAYLRGAKRVYMRFDRARLGKLMLDGEFEEVYDLPDTGNIKLDLPDRNPIVPGVTFFEAIKDLLRREPRLANSAAAVSRLYSTQKVFAMAKSISLKLTDRVKRAMGRLEQAGKGMREGVKEIKRLAVEESHEFSDAYAATVYRTNIATAYTAGDFEEASKPEIAEFMPAFEFVAQLDSRTRDNHRAAHGFIAPINSPEWQRIKPGLGYNCRCSLISRSKYELERRGLIKNGVVQEYRPPSFNMAGPDPGFRPGFE